MEKIGEPSAVTRYLDLKGPKISVEVERGGVLE